MGSFKKKKKKKITISEPTVLIYVGNLKKTPIFIKEWVKNKWLYQLLFDFFTKK